MLLLFLRQEGDVLFHQNNARPHLAAATLRALCGVQQLPKPARSPDLSTVEQVWDKMTRELTLSPEHTTTAAELRQWVQDAWDNLSQYDIRHFYDRLNVRIYACVVARVEYTVYWSDYLGTSYCDICVSFGLNLLSYTPTMINYLSHQVSIQWTCPWWCWIFPVVFSGTWNCFIYFLQTPFNKRLRNYYTELRPHMLREFLCTDTVS